MTTIKKKSLLFLITLFTAIVCNAQTNTYSFTKIQVSETNGESWRDLITYRQFNLTIDENKNIKFYDQNMVLMQILAGKGYVGQYDNVSFSNNGAAIEDASKGIFAYNGKITLHSNKNFNIREDAYVYFYYYPGTSNLGMIEIRNKLCTCYVRLTVKKL